MTRTQKRRPLPLGTLTPREALLFSIITGFAAVLLFWLFFNLMAAMLALFTISFYSFFYTIYLKPRTPHNIVIGGAAGAMAPVIAWAAAAGTFSVIPWLLFAIIFFWTPPHFWSLALCLKDDYVKADLPMLPTVEKDSVTWKLIIRYTVITLLFSISLSLSGAGLLYFVVASVLGWLLLKKTIVAKRLTTKVASRKVFRFSIVYLLLLFTALILDKGLMGSY